MAQGPTEEIRAITADIERAILAHVHSGTGRELKSVYVWSALRDTSSFVAALDARLVSPCAVLPVCDMELSENSPRGQLAPFASALAAVHTV